ncbi:MAG: 1,4-alpha-glucan branching protein GlgB [Candidatus Eremiobacteraeota bacterium]|nr:1,4-alpha-glucan branching protein GlgB [Candidatus Eremiobacteraeota bacterium]MCW5871863.1 1,4-alpha-glucan branching protein GlgB [Candidatus Eremiobacteraeota bacterium]
MNTLQHTTMSDVDRYLWNSSKLHRSYRKLGAHLCNIDGLRGVHFAVWAPNAEAVHLMGSFNAWSRTATPMQHFDRDTGIWSAFLPGLEEGASYKYCITARSGGYLEKSDPYAFQGELRPSNASVIYDLNRYQWGDEHWLALRKEARPLESPMSIYEVHLGSWLRHLDNSWMTYRELAPRLIDHLSRIGYTHVELLPVTEFPYDGSWGYQATGYFAPTSRYGTPDDFRYLVDQLHQAGIGVILDWVPAHFPSDGHGLGYFDGTHLYEHSDPRQGAHPEWGTLIFNYGRNEVRNFLISSALFWLEHFHIDGLRVDAVASMLYLDYGRKEGEWIPNIHGGRENLEAISFLQELHRVLREEYPDVITFAEESTSFPRVTHPVEEGGLGFTFKWNMGWMHDVLDYFARDPIHRRWHHHQLTFGMMYQYSENYLLPFSHDEVVHLKKSMLDKMPGDEWQKRANLRTLYAHQLGHPGKKLLFMGSEFGQWREWSEERPLDWEAMGHENHRGLLEYTTVLQQLYRRYPALYRWDSRPDGFRWLDCDNAERCLLSWMRQGEENDARLVFVLNLTAEVKEYAIPVPFAESCKVVVNGDARRFGGSGVEMVEQTLTPVDGNLTVHIGPLCALILEVAPPPPPAEETAALNAKKRAVRSKNQ